MIQYSITVNVNSNFSFLWTSDSPRLLKFLKTYYSEYLVSLTVLALHVARRREPQETNRRLLGGISIYLDNFYSNLIPSSRARRRSDFFSWNDHNTSTQY